MGYASVEEIPLHYFCEQCKPDMYPGLQKYVDVVAIAIATSLTSFHAAEDLLNALVNPLPPLTIPL